VGICRRVSSKRLTGVAFPKNVKQPGVCQPERSEGSMQFSPPGNCQEAAISMEASAWRVSSI